MIQAIAEHTVAAAKAVTWRGRSGRLYALSARRLDALSLGPGEIYLLALGGRALWVGSADEIVEDPHSRARFRLALDCADRAFRVEAGADPLERMTVVWDLEGSEPASARSAA
jgi:hypothetical protein